MQRTALQQTSLAQRLEVKFLAKKTENTVGGIGLFWRNMNVNMFALIFFFPALVLGFCPFPQQNFPTEQLDEQHAMGVRARELQTARSNLERQFPQINADISRTRNSVSYYLKAPWGDAVIAHMDNGFDCCHSTRQSAQATAQKTNRYPAGSDYVDAPVTGGGSEVVDPLPYDEEPAPAPSYPEPSYPEPTGGDNYSCNGYSGDFCQSNWGRNDSPSNGGLCLQTGFAATNAWYSASCRSGGRVNPGICGDARISNYPNDYEQCVQILNEYYRLSRAKRRMSGQIQTYNDQIRGLNQERRGNFGALAGNFLRAAGPFLLMYAISQQSQSSVRQQYQTQRPRYGGVGSMGQPNSLSGRYSGGSSSQAPNFYGADYGHPFQSGGMMGQILPAMMSGGFGCSEGSGSGLGSVLPLLMGGNLGGNFDGNLGVAPYQPGGISGGGSRGTSGNDRGNGWIGPARPQTGGNYLGQERNAVFYDMLGGARQRIYDSNAESEQISRMMSGGGGSMPGMGNITGSLNLNVGASSQQSPTYAPGMDSFGLIQSLLMGGSTGATFNLQSVPPGF